jgi:hypothetical protein
MATRKTRTDKVKGFNTLEELRTAYKNSIIKVSEDVMYDDRLTTYGRAIVADIIGTELDNILGEGVPITAGNISEVVRFLGTRENRVTALQRLQNFGSEIATHVGLDSLPFDNIYGDDTKNIKAITESAEPVGVRVNKLKKYLEDTMTAKLNKNPDSNLSHLIKGSGRVKYSQLVEIYAPTMIIKGDKIVIDKSNVFEGLSQRAYTELAKNNRVLLEMKNELTPVGGYDNRQLVNLQMRLTYKNTNNPNPDTVGVLIPRKFALGRTTLEGEIIKANNDNDLVRVRSTINNTGNIVYRDEIDSTKMSILDGSGIGCNFATALMEGVTQAALALKHGGSTINYENYVVTALEDGVVTSINNNYLEITGKHIYKYILSLYASVNVKLSVGDKVSSGDKLIFSTKRTEIDQALRNFNTLVDTHVTGALGAKSKKILSRTTNKLRGFRIICVTVASATGLKAHVIGRFRAIVSGELHCQFGEIQKAK